MTDTLRSLLPVLWLLVASLASVWALRHFLRTGHPASTLTVVAVCATGGLWYFAFPRFGALLWPQVALMVVAAVLALSALLVPIIGKLHTQRA
jgi:type IV secretory pathway VirB2 component (pilin)